MVRDHRLRRYRDGAAVRSDYCPHCLGEGVVFPDSIKDWIACEPCKGTGRRQEDEE